MAVWLQQNTLSIRTQHRSSSVRNYVETCPHVAVFTKNRYFHLDIQ